MKQPFLQDCKRWNEFINKGQIASKMTATGNVLNFAADGLLLCMRSVIRVVIKESGNVGSENERHLRLTETKR